MENTEWILKMMPLMAGKEVKTSDIKTVSIEELSETIDNDFNNRLSNLIEENIDVLNKPLIP